jgi:hypothetical protein
MKSGLRICSREQNRHHRRVDPLRNQRLARIDSHHSKPFLLDNSDIFRAFSEIRKNGRVTLKKRLSLRPMAQMTVACHFRVSIGASLEFSASLIIEKFHSDRTFCATAVWLHWPTSQGLPSQGQNEPELDYFDRQKRSKKVFRYACKTSTVASGCPSGNSQSSWKVS